ncbi:MAG: DNA alkylation repair protein [Candidatus Nanosyncoccaceae bacterium]|jgi:hypothetical protein
MRNINAKLKKLTIGNKKYAEFQAKTINTKKTILGVRMPDLRKLAKKLARDLSQKEIEGLLSEVDANIYERVLLCGLVISYAKLDDKQRIALTKKYLELADSWAEIDSFVTKHPKEASTIWREFVSECLKSPHEFVVRYGIVELMTNFLDQKSITTTLAKIRDIKHDGYYVKMAIAWLYATAAIDNFDLIITEVKANQVDNWTKQKALQKMIESFQISNEQKTAVRKAKQELKNLDPSRPLL